MPTEVGHKLPLAPVKKCTISAQLFRHSSRYVVTEIQVEARFWELCERIDREDTVESSVPDLEPSLLELLTFIKSEPQHEKLFIRCFCQIGTGQRISTSWIILFCMRELRYAEVQNAVNADFEQRGGPSKVPRLMNYVSDINWVFDDSPWEDALFFKYYWQKEHPHEPWPCERHT